MPTTGNPYRHHQAGGIVNDLLHYLPLTEPAQRAALSNDEHARKLAGNRHVSLHPDVWAELWNRRHDASEAYDLAARALTTDQLDVVLASEKRTNVLVAALTHNPPNATQRRTLYQLRVAGPVLGRCATDTWRLSDDETRQVAWLAGGSKLLAWLDDHRDELDDDDLIAAVARPGRWIGRVTAADAAVLARLVGNRPRVVAALCDPAVAPTVAACAAAWPQLHDENLQRALATRQPYAHGWGTDAGTAQTAELWTELARNPATTTATLHTLHHHLDEVVVAHPQNCEWGTWRWTCASRAVGVALDNRTDGTRPDPATEPLSVVGYPVIDAVIARITPPKTASSGRRWQPMGVYAASELAANPQLGASRARRLADALAHPQVVSVLGAAESRRISDDLYHRWGVTATQPRKRQRGTATRVPYHWDEPRAHHGPGGPVPLWDVYRLDDVTAQRVAGALQRQTSWEALYALLGDCTATDDTDLGELVRAAAALGGEIPTW
jgi:hypothetical protein